MFVIQRWSIIAKALSAFIAILLANVTTLCADDPAAWMQRVVELAAKEYPDKPTPSEVDSAFAPETHEDQRHATIERMFAHLAADDLPLSKLVTMLQDQQLKPETRENSAACLVKIICGQHPDRSAAAERALFDEFRNATNALEFRGNIMDKLAGVTRSPHLLLADLVSLVTDPASTPEHFEIAHRGMTTLVSYRQVVTREAAWAALRVGYNGCEPGSKGRSFATAFMFMISHFHSEAEPPSRQLLSDAEEFASEVFRDARNDDKVRENAATEIGLFFRVSPEVLQTANGLLGAENTGPELRAECAEIVARAAKSDLMRNLELIAYYALTKGFKDMLHTPPAAQK